MGAHDPHPGERTLKLTLAYDGTPFVGWQRQAAGTSIQGLLEDALARIEGAPVAVIGAGRTDAGVHAWGQVASVRLASPIDPATLRRALNAVLPPEIRVTGLREMPPAFHARYAAISKTYHYRIVNGPTSTPFEWRYAWHVCERLDVDRMGAAAALFEGEHDFAAFRATGSSVKTSVRLVSRSRWSSPFGQLRAVGRPDARRRRHRASGVTRSRPPAFCGTWCGRWSGRWSRLAPAAATPIHRAGIRIRKSRGRRADGAGARAVPG